MAENSQEASQRVVAKVCPKCNYERKITDEVPDWQCPACGVAYAKVEQGAATSQRQSSAESPSSNTERQPVSGENTSVIGKEAGVSKKRVLVTAVSCLVIGYFAGREHLKYEVRSAIGSAFNGITSSFNSSFGGVSTSGAEPVSKPEPRQSLPAPTPVDTGPVMVTLLSKEFLPSNASAQRYRDYITFKLRFDNTEGRDIRAFQGTVNFYDLLGNLLLAANVAINDPVSANTYMEWSGQIEYNQFKENHLSLRNAEFQNMKVNFELEKVLFSNGTVKEFN